MMTTEKLNVSYSIEAPGIGYYDSGIITAEHEAILHLPRSVVVSSNYDDDKGIYIRTSSRMVTVHGQAFAQDYNYWTRYYSYETHLETFVAIPVTDLCSSEYIYYAISVDSYSSGYNSTVLVVGTENNTSMKLTVRQPLTVMVDSTFTDLIPGKEYLFVINRLETVYIESQDDLTGSKIVTDKQVSVFSGHQYGNVTNTLSSDIYSRSSYLVEQIPPTILWSKVYYVMPLSKLSSDIYVIKVVASEQCVIKIYCNSSFPTFTTALYEGQFVNVTFSNDEYCTVLSTAKVIVSQFSLGVLDLSGVMMTLVPSTKQYYSNFILSTIQLQSNNSDVKGYTWYHYVNIIVTAEYYQPDMIYITEDGYNRSLNTEEWIPIKVNNLIEAYATRVNITYGTSNIFHINDAAMMMIIMYGLSDYGSYGTATSNSINKGVISLYLCMCRYFTSCVHTTVILYICLQYTYSLKNHKAIKKY